MAKGNVLYIRYMKVSYFFFVQYLNSFISQVLSYSVGGIQKTTKYGLHTNFHLHETCTVVTKKERKSGKEKSTMTSVYYNKVKLL